MFDILYRRAVFHRLMDFVNPTWRIANSEPVVDPTVAWQAYANYTPPKPKPLLFSYDDAKRLAEEDAERQAAWL